MRIRRISTLFSLLLMMDLILSGCGLVGGYQGAYEAGVIRVWTTWSDDPAHLQALFDRYSQQSGLKIKVLTGVKSDKIQDALTSSTPPEIIILSSSALVRSYAKQGLIEPLDTWVKTAGIDLGDIYPAPLAQCELQPGTHTCLPWGSDVFALYWNKDLFKAAGLDPERPPQTTEALAEYAQKLTVRSTQGKVSQIGFIPDFPRPHTDLYAQMFGGGWYDSAGDRLTANAQPVVDAEIWQQQFFNTAGFEKANQFIASFDHYRDSSHPVYAGTRLNCQQCHRVTPRSIDKVPDSGFYSGKVAMMLDGEWQVGAKYIAAFQPNLNYGVAPFPPPADHPERANTAVVQGAVVIIPAKLKDKAAAANLLAWMMSPAIVADETYANSSLPTSRTAAQDPRFKQIPNFQVFMDLLASPNASNDRSTSLTAEVNQALLQAERDLLHKKGGDPAAQLNKIQTKLAP